MKLHEYSPLSIVGSNGSQHKFLASSKPSDRYVINVSDIGPQRKVEEFFTRVGVSFSALALLRTNLSKTLSEAELLHKWSEYDCCEGKNKRLTEPYEEVPLS